MSSGVGQRRLATILIADVVGSSRLIEADESRALATIHFALHDVLTTSAIRHGGRVFKSMGDGALIEFASPVEAVTCADEVQRTLAAHNTADRPDRAVLLRIGINLGDVVATPDGDLYGDGVNIAARLESIAEPGGIAISGTVHDHLAGKIALQWRDRGEQALKNITRPIRVHASAGAAPIACEMPELPDKPSIAVLPFDNMSGDPGQDYFADGIVEEIITALSRFRQLFVIARNSSFAFKGRAVDIKQVGRELGVRYVLEGSVRKAGNRLRISGQLIDTSNESHLWADRFDGPVEDVFDLQDKVMLGVIGAIEPTIRQAEIERSRRKRPENLSAYDCVMRAMPAFWSADASTRGTALQLLERAIAIDPEYALARALAAWCHAQNVSYHSTQSPSHERSESIRLAEEAVRLDSEDPMVLTALAAAYAMARRVSEASSLVERALLLNPNSAWIWQRSAWNYLYRGEYDEAIERFRASVRRSPRDPLNYNAYFGIGCAYFGQSRYADAVEWLQHAIGSRPSASFIYRVLASALAHLDRIEEAKQAAATFRTHHPEMTISKIAASLPMTSQSYVDRFCEGARKAGLPE